MNYLNKFGEITPGRVQDLRQRRASCTTRPFATSRTRATCRSGATCRAAAPSTRRTWADGFPVITDWDDPILYSCQRNFILGIGDVNTHADKNVPGNTTSNNEPAMPPLVAADTTVNAVTRHQQDRRPRGPRAPRSACTRPTAAAAATTRPDRRPGLRLAHQGHPAATTSWRWPDARPDHASIPTGSTCWNTRPTRPTTSSTWRPSTAASRFRAATTSRTTRRRSPLDLVARPTPTSISGQPRPDNYFSGGTARPGAGRPEQRVRRHRLQDQVVHDVVLDFAAAGRRRRQRSLQQPVRRRATGKARSRRAS